MLQCRLLCTLFSICLALLFFRPSRRNHKQIIKTGRNRPLVLPKRLSQEAFEPIAHNCFAAGFADRNPQSRMATIVLCHPERKQAVAGTQVTSQNSFELFATSNLFFSGKRKLFQDSTEICFVIIRPAGWPSSRLMTIGRM